MITFLCDCQTTELLDTIDWTQVIIAFMVFLWFWAVSR